MFCYTSRGALAETSVMGTKRSLDIYLLNNIVSLRFCYTSRGALAETSVMGTKRSLDIYLLNNVFSSRFVTPVVEHWLKRVLWVPKGL